MLVNELVFIVFLKREINQILINHAKAGEKGSEVKKGVILLYLVEEVKS